MQHFCFPRCEIRRKVHLEWWLEILHAFHDYKLLPKSRNMNQMLILEIKSLVAFYFSSLKNKFWEVENVFVFDPSGTWPRPIHSKKGSKARSGSYSSISEKKKNREVNNRLPNSRHRNLTGSLEVVEAPKANMWWTDGQLPPLTHTTNMELASCGLRIACTHTRVIFELY